MVKYGKPKLDSPSRRTFLRTSLFVGATLGLSACLPTCGGSSPESANRPAADRLTTLKIQHPFGGSTITQMDQLWAGYEAIQEEVGIEATWVLNDLETNETFFAAVAAGEPPDISWVDGQQVAEWAERGVLADLSGYFDATGLGEADFWAPCWRQNFYKGKSWGITYTADANFGFFWNKRLFAEAGLDPEAPPVTVDEVRQFNQALTQRSGDSFSQMGTIPWSTYGLPNAMFTWGWIFGGEFFDENSNTVTADHLGNVAALEWMLTVAADGGGFEEVAAFENSFSGDAGHLFFQEALGMAFLGPWELANIERIAPDLDYGITHAPAGPPPAEPNSSWVGGWSLGIALGAPQPDAAWEFARWLCATDEGTNLFGRLFNQTPGYRHSSWYDLLTAEQPRMSQFVDILQEARHQRPVMAAQATYMGSLQNHVEAALLGYDSPQEALAMAGAETQAVLDEILQER